MITGASRASRQALVAAELGLLALALGTAASFTRLFIGWGFLGNVAPIVALAWVTALALRRGRVGVGIALPVHLAVGVVAVSAWFASGTQALVVLPSPTTVDTLHAAITRSFAEVPDLIAPVTPSDGFLVVIAAGLWVLAFFGDTAAFRYRGTVQAAVPYGAVFVATGILARDSGRTAAAITFGAGVAVYAITQRALTASEQRWVPGDDLRGTRATMAGAAGVAVLALVAGAIVGPLLPAGTDPVVDLRELGKGGGPRTVVSPFVSIRSLLDERSDQIMFRVRADAPAYWRLTALEEFRPEGDIWVSHGSYDDSDGPLPRSVDADVPATSLAQDIEIAGLVSDWLPGAYAPSRIESALPVSYNRDSSSIILAEDAAAGPVRYSLESLVPDFRAVEQTPGATSDVDPIHLRSPGLTVDQRASLDVVVAGADDAMAQMIALQNWFRDSFVYDEEVDYSSEPNSLNAFLDAKRGFCQQFSSAFALLARELGLPSRVAVGFTPGDPTADSDGDIEFVVRGRHAHAWPEIHFAGVGWVPFEPTPQRGDPQSEGHTGVPPEQAAPPPAQAVTTTSIVEEPEADPAPPTTAGSELDATDDEPPEETPESSDGDGPAWPLIAAIVVLVAAALWAAVRFARRRVGPRRAGHPHDAHVADAWSTAVRQLQPLDLRPADHETPLEFAERVEGRLGTDLLGELAVIETQRRYAPEDASADDAQIAERAAQHVGEFVRETTTRGQRVAALVGRTRTTSGTSRDDEMTDTLPD